MNNNSNGTCVSHLLPWIAVLAAASCSDSGSTPGGSAGTSATRESITTGMPAQYWSDAPLQGAVNVVDIRDSGADGDAIVLRGTLQDFGELATFRLVEDSLHDCAEDGEKDHCATPWDFCCEDPAKLRLLTVNVEFLDGSLPESWSLKGQHGLERLTEVAVAGVLRIDSSGNLRLEASKMSMQ